MRTLFVLALLCTIASFGYSQTTWYVPDDFPTIQGAISDPSVVNGDTIIVRPNTYVENIDYLGKAITVMSEQGPDVTVIDGMNPANPNYKSVVVFKNGETPDSVLEGFTLINGNGSLGYGGWFHGGGIFCDNASPTIINNIISNNTIPTNGRGGGMNTYQCGDVTVIDCTFIENTAGYRGGGLANDHTNITLINCSFIDNFAPHIGGGMYSFLGEINVINCTFSGNIAALGGGYCQTSSTATVTNCILWGDLPEEIFINGAIYPTLTYSCVQDGWPGQGNIDADPLFVDEANNDLHLSWLSPCINRGTNNDAPPDDIDGDPRPYMGTVDMGADEFVGTHTLAADGFSVSEITGGTVNFTLTGGLDNNGRGYILLGGVTGTAPGTPLPGGLETLRLNWDVFTDFVLAFIYTPVFTNFLSTLDATGSATAQLNAPPVPGFAGVTMHYAYALNNPFDFVSNPVAIEIAP